MKKDFRNFKRFVAIFMLALMVVIAPVEAFAQEKINSKEPIKTELQTQDEPSIRNSGDDDDFTKDGRFDGGSFVKVSNSLLQRYNINAHQLKYDTLSRSAPISQYNIYREKTSNELFLCRNGSSNLIPTYVYLD